MKQLYKICLVLLILSSAIPAQNYFRLKGEVTDSKGKPLVGANIYNQLNRIGTATDADGKYTLDIPKTLFKGKRQPGILLEARFVGYKTVSREIILSKDEMIEDFILNEDILNLESVVVTGQGTKISKEKLGTTIGKIDPDEIVNSNEQNIISAIAGKVANVEVTSNSGDPGASSYLRIRGAHSIIGGTQPLIVVDGSPVNNQEIHLDNDDYFGGVTQENRASDIDPNDIESIEILKGAAAAALYGARAQNGVVLITTKSGKPGAVRASYKIDYSFEDVTNLQSLQTLYGQGVDGEASTSSPLSWGPKLAPGTQVFDHQNEIFQTGQLVNQYLNVSGGNEWTTYYLSAGRVGQSGTIVGKQDYTRNNVRLKASQRINPDLNFTGNFAYSDVSSNRIQKGSNVSGVLLGEWRTPPDFNNLPYFDPVTGLHRSYRYQNPTELIQTRGYDNPFFVVNEQVNNTEVGRVFGNLTVDWDAFNWLNINYILGNDYSNDERRTVLPPSSSTQPDGKVVREKYTYNELDGNLLITARRQFEPADLGVILLLGQNFNQRKFNGFTTYGYTMAVQGFDHLDNTSSYAPTEYENVIRSESYFGEAQISLFNQLYINAGLRNDGSSTFGESKKRHWYPKVSGAWDITNAGYLNPLPWISFAKIRAAYGESGQEPNVYSTIVATYESSALAFWDPWGGYWTSSPFGYNGFYTSLQKGNNNILPQRTKEFETGFNFGFLDDEIGLDFTYYKDKTTDAIYYIQTAPSTGYTSQIKNAGVIQNEGIELGLNLQPVNVNNFKWDIGLLYARNRNIVLELPGVDYYSLGGFVGAEGIVKQGYPIGVFYGYDYIRFGRGIIIDGVNIDQAYSGWKAGDMYIAEDGYPVMDPESRVYGDPNPDWTGSVRTSFTLFNDITISALFDIKQGGDVWDGTLGALTYFGTAQLTADRGTTTVFPGEGPGAGKTVVKDQNYYTGIGNSFTGPSSANVEDGSFVKLREITIGYTLRLQSVRDLTGIKSIDLRLSSRNIYTWTNYKGIDPETNLTGNTNLRGLDYFNNPQTRSFVFSLRLNY